MNREDYLRRLLHFYLACIEAEDRRSLQKKLSALHHTLISPWDTEEPFFYPEAPEVQFNANLKSDQKVLLRGAALTGNADRMYYGYPIHLDENGYISPLFVAEVDVNHIEGSRFAMRPANSGEILLNHHIFRRRHTQTEELRAIQEELEGRFGSFADRLRAAFDALAIPLPPFPPDQLEQYPKFDSPRERWINRPILFRSERSVYSRHLRRELEALAKYERLFNAIGKTAAGFLFGLSPLESSVAAKQSRHPHLLQVLPLNMNQEKAAMAALTTPLTVVTGPPGTGKSQLVVDILASCAATGVPVLFASKNNKAVDVVRTRLQALLGEEQDWTLRLGSRHAMEETREKIDARLDHFRSKKVRPPPAPELLYELDEEIGKIRRRVEKLEQDRVRLEGLERNRRIAASLIPSRWIDSWVPESSLPDLSRLEKQTTTAEALAGKRPTSYWLKLLRVLMPKHLRRKMLAELAFLTLTLPSTIREDLKKTAGESNTASFSSLAEAFIKLTRLARWRAAEDECSRALAKLNSEEPASVLAKRLDELQRRRSELTCEQLKSVWTNRITKNGSTTRHLLDRYFDLSSRLQQSRKDSFLRVLEEFRTTVESIGIDFPIWIVTNLSVRNALPLEPAIFDLVIIDEASQCDIPSAFPLLFRARRALIIGDPQQLRHISTLSSQEEEKLAIQHGVGELLTTWSYNQRSLYALAEERILVGGNKPLFLAEHYRSHPKIIEFVNHCFYQGQLVIRTPLNHLADHLKSDNLGLFWHDVRGIVPLSSRSAYNEVELRAVLELLDKWAQSGFLLRDEVSFGVVTPFRLQMERLEEAIRARPWWNQVNGRLTVGTAHRFQGDERDIMIMSPVVSEGMHPRLVRWVSETGQLLNVAITRGRGALHIVGDVKACLSAGGFLAKLASPVRDGQLSRNRTPIFDSPDETRMAEFLAEVGLWFEAHHPVGKYQLDFLVISPFGTRYDLEVDGRGHWTDEATHHDEIRDAAIAALGMKIVRISARQIFNNKDGVCELLRRLV